MLRARVVTVSPWLTSSAKQHSKVCNPSLLGPEAPAAHLEARNLGFQLAGAAAVRVALRRQHLPSHLLRPQRSHLRNILLGVARPLVSRTTLRSTGRKGTHELLGCGFQAVVACQACHAGRSKLRARSLVVYKPARIIVWYGPGLTPQVSLIRLNVLDPVEVHLLPGPCISGKASISSCQPQVNCQDCRPSHLPLRGAPAHVLLDDNGGCKPPRLRGGAFRCAAAGDGVAPVPAPLDVHPDPLLDRRRPLVAARRYKPLCDYNEHG